MYTVQYIKRVTSNQCSAVSGLSTMQPIQLAYALVDSLNFIELIFYIILNLAEYCIKLKDLLMLFLNLNADQSRTKT